MCGGRAEGDTVRPAGGEHPDEPTRVPVLTQPPAVAEEISHV